MKIKRCAAARETEEDREIWLLLDCKFGIYQWAMIGHKEERRPIYLVYKKDDERDANIMFVLKRMKKLHQPSDQTDDPCSMYCMAHCLMRVEWRDSGTFDWIPAR